MRHIEATITAAQASELESLKKTVKQLCGELKTYENLLQTNIDEITEAVEISEAKTSASVSDLCGTFDGQLQAAAETTDKKINDRGEVVRADTVRSLVNQAKKIEEIRMSFDKQIREAVKQAVENQEAARPKFKKLAANGIFFTGLDVIRKREKEGDVDVTSVVHNILHKVGSAPYYTDIIAIHLKSSPRSAANSAIIYFQSTYHKNHAAAQIRMMLHQEKYIKIGIHDLFNPVDILTSKALTAKGFELKRRDVISKFRISNLEDMPTMFIAKRGGA